MVQQRAVKVLPGRGRVTAHINESAAALRQAQDFRRDSEDTGLDIWQGRQLGSNASLERDMTPMERLRAIRLSRTNYKRSGVYGQILDKIVDFTLGDGIAIEGFESPSVERHVRRFLENPLNAWDRKLKDRWRACLTDGELVLNVMTDRRNPGEIGRPVPTGLVRLGRYEPDQIVDVSVSKHNQDRIVDLTLEIELSKKKFPIAEPGRMPTENETVVDGKVVKDGTMSALSYWAVNQLGVRGLPYLSRSIDKATMLDELVEALSRKAEYTNRFWVHGVYDPTGDDSKDKAFEEKLLGFLTSALPGEAQVTSKDVEIKVLAPDLKMPDHASLYELVLDYILGSHGIPRMWFSSGGDTNRATAVEQGTPIHRSLLSLQEELRCNIEDLILYVVWLGKESGRIPIDAPTGFSVVMSQTATRDTLRDVDEMMRLSTMLTEAVVSGKLHPGEAQTAFRNAFAAKTQWEIDLEEEPPDPSAMATIAPVIPALESRLPGHRRQRRGETE